MSVNVVNSCDQHEHEKNLHGELMKLLIMCIPVEMTGFRLLERHSPNQIQQPEEGCINSVLWESWGILHLYIIQQYITSVISRFLTTM